MVSVPRIIFSNRFGRFFVTFHNILVLWVLAWVLLTGIRLDNETKRPSPGPWWKYTFILGGGKVRSIQSIMLPCLKGEAGHM